MKNLSPYLMFNGNCEEAMYFYQDCLGGKIEYMRRYTNTPLDVPEDKQKKIMHAEFSFWGGNLMFSDLMDEANFTTPATASNIHLNLGFEDKNKMQETFDKLKQGGKVTTELEEQFWGDIFGMVQDKYGINWMFICPAEK